MSEGEAALAMGVHNAAADRGWRFALPLVASAVAAVLAIHATTVESIVAIWWRSETFAHGFLIAPIVLVLIWQRRRMLAGLTPRPDWLGVLVLVGAGAVWLVGYAGEVLVVKQLALVASIWGVVISVVGRDVARAMTFPLAFLVLAVPMGEVLIPPLMEWTADFTVVALQLSGIPVFREGLFFSIPSGDWSIVEGCSGVRYLIASFTVGVLFANLSYRLTRKRLLFVALSVVVPIIANGLRAYLIVMIAHLSGNQLAHGIDHFIYGWVFFGVVMLLLFWVGSFWRDSDPKPEVAAPAASVPVAPHARLAAYAAIAVATVAAWPVYAAHLDEESIASSQSALNLVAPAGTGGWVIDPGALTDWRPHFDPPSASLFQVYRKGSDTVALYLGYYRSQRRGAQLVSSGNVMVIQKHPVWSDVGEGHVEAAIGQAVLEARQTLLRSPQQRLLIWDWYRIGDRDIVSPYVAKWALALDKLASRGDAGAAIILATPYDDQAQPPVRVLRDFVSAMRAPINGALSRAEAEILAKGQ